MVLLSGHAATWELGRGGFQELRQADMAAPVTKASWTATSAARLAGDIARAMHLAVSGRPGPVHVSLPSDLLDAQLDDASAPQPAAPKLAPALSDIDADAVLSAIGSAARPLLIGGPALSNPAGRARLAELETATGTPAVIVESPRGLADATLGAFLDVVRHADLIVLLGKALDFTIKWTTGPAFDPAVRLIAIDPDPALVERARREAGERFVRGAVADPRRALETLIGRADRQPARDRAWLAEARRAIDHRPAEWATIASDRPGRLHPAEVFRALRPFVERDPSAVLVCDGGEFAQWAQSMLPVRRRLINGVAGAIGPSLPFALASRLAEPSAPVFAILGDGTAGFHIAEFETAVRRRLPFVAVIGNDARWNAESQIQLRDYGAQRMHGCDLLPARYDQVAAALGAHAEFVDSAAALPDAIARALASGKPACINVMIESVAAPALRLG
jgi:acetolactate synthase-1/2/3 large subunit